MHATTPHSGRTTVLCILDGFGLNPNPLGNAVQQAHTPNIDALMASAPNATLVTFGERVGLPAGQMGNSEVGHLNIGAGREVEQWLLRISRALAGSFLDTSESYQKFLAATTHAPRIHVVGLYSSGGVHSHAHHLQLLLKRLSADYRGEVVLHLISDGRDVSPTVCKRDLEELQHSIKDLSNCKIQSICGRFYAMDRDKRWERVQVAYNAIAQAKGKLCSDLLSALADSYAAGITDEFIEPLVCSDTPIGPNDGLLFFNFREDRMREIVAALCSPRFTEFPRPTAPPPAERVLCFTTYDHTFNLPALFAPVEITNHLGEVVAAAGLTQLRVAETEKYPHVTYFLNGGIEAPYRGEERTMIPSPRDVKTYDQKPEMSAFGVAETVVSAIHSGKYDLIIVNFANCDMVGHTGVLAATIKAVETTDTCLGQILTALKRSAGQALIIADHGNAEQLVQYDDGSPHTAHTTYPVPVILVGYPRPVTLRTDGALCDVAPTVLEMLGLPRPHEMTGRSLLT